MARSSDLALPAPRAGLFEWLQARLDWRHAALSGLLALGLFLRLFGLNWDAGAHLHPDERMIVMTVGKLAVPPGVGLPALLDAERSPLNPHFFAYGSMPMYLLKFAGYVASFRDPWWAGYDGIDLLGRGLSAIFDTGSILLVYLLGARLYRREVGLIAAAFATVSVFGIQLAHFYAVDTPLTFFVLLTLLACLSLAREGSLRAALLAGLAFGLALSCKASAAPLALPLAVACAVGQWRRAARARDNGQPALAAVGQEAFWLLLPALGVAAATFVALDPFAWLDRAKFLQDVASQSQMARGTADLPYTRQFAGTTPYLYFLKNMVLWNLGPALGVVCLAGWAFVLWRTARRPRAEEVVVLAWVVPYFLVTGDFYAKFIRYMLPIAPALYVFGAELLATGLRGGAGSLAGNLQHPAVGRWLRRASVVALAATLALTAAWAAAFEHIYAVPHSRITASAWIYANVPPGSSLSTEVWDDDLPLPMPRHSIGEYRVTHMALYEEDTPAKFLELKRKLAATDYVILSSNRVRGSIIRTPFRYPLTTAYYTALFDGSLGYQLAARFTSYPRLGPWEIPDDAADESFWVYDHPQVWIFHKARQLSDQEMDALFAAPLRAVSPPLYQPGVDKTLLLSPQQWAQRSRVGTLASMFDPGDLANRASIPVWWLAIELLGLAAWALLYRFARVLPDGGYAASKVVGVVLLAYLSWILPSLQLVSYGPATVRRCALVILAAGAAAGWAQRAALLRHARARLGLLLSGESVLLGAYLAFVGIRLWNPDLWHPYRGGEKPMELAFLHAILRSDTFPPYDPWFAHGYINYYYFGQLIVATLIHLTGIVPTVAFNLAIPALFGLTALGVYGVVANLLLLRGTTLRAAAAYALAGVACAVVLGNLAGARQALQKGTLAGYDYWAPTRLIPGTINEFPFFSFLYADLHAHVIALPIAMAGVGLALAVAAGASAWWGLPWLALTIGSLAAVNSWDVPTQLLILAGALALRQACRGKMAPRDWWLALRQWACAASLAVLLFAPFFASFKSFYGSLGIAQYHTTLGLYLLMYGLLLFIAASWLAALLWAGPGLPPELGWRRRVYYTLFAALLISATGQRLPGVLILLLALAALAWWPRRGNLSTSFTLGLLGMALAISLGIEVFYVRDFLQGGESQRMNTVFKFGLQVWMLLSVVAGVGLYETAGALRERATALWAQRLADGWRLALACLVAGAMAYPLGATWTRVHDRFNNAIHDGLDGVAYLRAVYPEDYATIDWLNHNASGLPVLLESSTGPYKWESRLSTYTGLPDLVGWDNHERQQRYPWMVDERLPAIRAIYTGVDPAATLNLLHRYGVDYVYVGEAERAAYGEGGMAKFDAMVGKGLELAFRAGRSSLYRVAPA